MLSTVFDFLVSALNYMDSSNISGCIMYLHEWRNFQRLQGEQADHTHTVSQWQTQAKAG